MHLQRQSAFPARLEAAGIKLIRTGSPYAVTPGRVLKPSDGTPYKVYTPFYRGWRTHGWRAPAVTPKKINCVEPTAEYRSFPDFRLPEGVEIIEAGEAAALARFKEFSKKALDSYDESRNLAGIDGTSKMSTYLKFGEIHPRTLLKGLGEDKAHDTFRKEIAWREFYLMLKNIGVDFIPKQLIGIRCKRVMIFMRDGITVNTILRILGNSLTS